MRFRGSDRDLNSQKELRIRVVAKRRMMRMKGALYFEVLRNGCFRL